MERDSESDAHSREQIEVRASDWLAVCLLFFNVGYLSLHYGKARTNEKPAPSSAAATLQFESSTLRLGQIDQDEVVTRKIVYTNTGHQKLEIIDVESSCGCTVAEFTKRVLAPGESGEFTVEFAADSVTGPFEKTISVSYQGQTVPSVLRVTGEIVAVVGISPEVVQLKAGETVFFEIVGQRADMEFEVLGFSSDLPQLEAKIVDRVSPKAYRATVTATAPLPEPQVGNVHPLLIHTDVSALEPLYLYILPGDVR